MSDGIAKTQDPPLMSSYPECRLKISPLVFFMKTISPNGFIGDIPSMEIMSTNRRNGKSNIQTIPGKLCKSFRFEYKSERTQES